MLDLNLIQKYDSQKIYQIYDKWPEIAKSCFKENFSKLDVNNIDHIVFAGMGGSGTIGDIISSILSKTDIHVSVVKGYLLPKTVDANTLVVTTSVSGNTDETLRVLQYSTTTKAKFIAFSSGGKLEEFSQKNGIQHVKISQLHSPRASLTKYLYSILNVLENILPINRIDTLESISMLENTRKEIYSSRLDEKNPSISLAKWIINTPIVYYPWGLQSAAIRFKNSLQENSKIHVITEDVIESCHNGIVSWQKSKDIQPILIRGKDDYIKTKERWEILKEFFEKNNIDYYEIVSNKGNVLSKIINLIYLLDYTSIYHAILNKTDPTPVDAINFVKERLK